MREKIPPGQPCGPALAIRAELVLGLLALPWERRLALLLLSRPTLTPCGYANFSGVERVVARLKTPSRPGNGGRR